MTHFQIRHRSTDVVLHEGDYKTLTQALTDGIKQKKDLRDANLRGAWLQGADLRGAYLRGANLQGVYLQGTNLRGAYLQGARLQGADLQGADLRGADLQGANLQVAHLQGTDLRGACFRGARINWQSHQLIGELLRIASNDDIEKCKIAGLIIISTNLCWDQFLAINDPLREWALDALAGYVTDQDDAPEILTERKKEVTA